MGGTVKLEFKKTEVGKRVMDHYIDVSGLEFKPGEVKEVSEEKAKYLMAKFPKNFFRVSGQTAKPHK